MTIWSPVNIGHHWLSNGGSRTGLVSAIAVALAESGGNDHAISSSHDFGVWQINWIHFGTVGIAANNWMDIDVNARAAIAISGNGSNWAAWCTAWADPGPNCGHGFLSAPQIKSAAYYHLADAQAAAQVLGVLDNVHISTTPGLASVQDSFAKVQSFVGKGGRSRYAQLTGISAAVKGIST